MIDDRILKELTSRDGDIGYSLLITKFTQDDECNSENITITMHQVDKSPSEIEQNSNAVVKELNIASVLDYDKTTNLFCTKLIGKTNHRNRAIIMDESETYNSHYIEMVVTALQPTIEIEFTKPFTNLPSINITMDSQTKRLFKEYSYDFQQENDVYTGVTITFTKVRHRTVYPDINILIIGDKIDNTGGN